MRIPKAGMAQHVNVWVSGAGLVFHQGASRSVVGSSSAEIGGIYSNYYVVAGKPA